MSDFILRIIYYPLIVACEGISDDFQMKIVMYIHVHVYTYVCIILYRFTSV